MPDDRGVPLPPSAQALLDAVVAISSDLDMHRVLDRIVRSACELTGARYGALGVIGPDGLLSDFVTHGLDEETRARIGDLPRGRGILRLLIDEPAPLRLADLHAHPLSYGFPPHHPPMTSFLGVPVRVRGTVFGNLYLTEKQGAPEFGLQDEALITSLAMAAGFVVENARAYDRSERQRAWLEQAALLSGVLTHPLDLGQALQQVATSVKEVARASAVGVYVVGEPVAGSGEARVDLVGRDGREVDLLEQVAAAAKHSVVDATRSNVTTEVRLDNEHRVLVTPLPTRLSPAAAVVAVYATEYAGSPFPAPERDLLTSFADQVALALDSAQAVADRAELAVVSDRERIARDLHDVVIQRLFATGLRLHGLRRQAPAPEVQARLEQAATELDTTIREIRTTIFDLQEQAAGSLRSSLGSLLAEYHGVLGYAPSLHTSGPVDTVVTGPVHEHVLAVVRESLSNIARHAHASRAEVEVAASADSLVVRVSDDGVGLPSQRAESGLRNVRCRASSLGGTLKLAGRDPRGTTVVWRVPLAAPGR